MNGASKVQQLAAAALKMCRTFGGRVPHNDLICRLSRIASMGQHPSNAERDLHVLLKKEVRQVEPEEVDVRMRDHKNARVIWAKVPVIMPDQLARAIWQLGRDVFHWFFMDKMSRDDCKAFWDHVYHTSDWYRSHPSSGRDRGGQIPLSFYGDEVACYKNTEVSQVVVLAWCSDFCYNRSPFTRYMLLTTYAEYAASDHTYDDIMTAVSASVTRLVDGSVNYPWSGLYNFMFSSNQGDLKFLLQKHHVHPYNSNRFCSWCLCTKKDPSGNVSMTLGDMREQADHISTGISHEEYMRDTPQAERY